MLEYAANRSKGSKRPSQFDTNRVYATVIVFGRIRVIEEAEEKRRALYGLIGKYYPMLTAGQEYRPITDQELKRISVYAIVIDSWSGTLRSRVTGRRKPSSAMSGPG
jgi:nitroimidazol reductase NimA-like FMN-containing flavoprotein (pyridoxamine 5'-phosphate oxidase superfamily)